MGGCRRGRSADSAWWRRQRRRGDACGDHVLRPSNLHSPSIHRILAALAEAGFAGASVPVGIDPDGRERLVFIPGDVAIPPYPAWVQSDTALGSITRLIRDMHDVSTAVAVGGNAMWSQEMADPVGGGVFCHNDAVTDEPGNTRQLRRERCVAPGLLPLPSIEPDQKQYPDQVRRDRRHPDLQIPPVPPRAFLEAWSRLNLTVGAS